MIGQLLPFSLNIYNTISVVIRLKDECTFQLSTVKSNGLLYCCQILKNENYWALSKVIFFIIWFFYWQRLYDNSFYSQNEQSIFWISIRHHPCQIYVRPQFNLLASWYLCLKWQKWKCPLSCYLQCSQISH